jgi:hypothetical protein
MKGDAILYYSGYSTMRTPMNVTQESVFCYDSTLSLSVAMAHEDSTL